MAAINDDVYARVREKIKEHNLTEQEVKAIDTARDQLQTHSKQLFEWARRTMGRLTCHHVAYTGGLTGAMAAFLLAKSKKFNPIQMLALTGGGFLMGSQMGLISGALAGVKTINTLPNPQRLINVVREVQQVSASSIWGWLTDCFMPRLEAMKGRQGINGPNAASSSSGGNHSSAGPTIRPHQMTPQELHEAQSPQDQFSPDMNENTSGDAGKANSSRMFANRPDLIPRAGLGVLHV